VTAVLPGAAVEPSGTRAAVTAPRAAVVVVAAGCGVLTARPLLLEVAGIGPAPVLAVLFLCLLAVSVLWPARSGAAAAIAGRAVLPVLALGIAAFVAGRILAAGSPAAASPMSLVVGLNTLAAVAEEAFFRRLVYGALLAAGPAAAVVGSAAGPAASSAP